LDSKATPFPQSTQATAGTRLSWMCCAILGTIKGQLCPGCTGQVFQAAVAVGWRNAKGRQL
jgi:hypothetical protein